MLAGADAQVHVVQDHALAAGHIHSAELKEIRFAVFTGLNLAGRIAIHKSQLIRTESSRGNPHRLFHGCVTAAASLAAVHQLVSPLQELLPGFTGTGERGAH